MSNLPLKDDVDVIIDVGPSTTPRKEFNIGLLLGKTTTITPEDRVSFYSSLKEMIEDGFSIDDSLYKGAELYFSQDGNLGASIQGVCIGAIAEGEDLKTVLMDCREKNNDWYGFSTVDELTDADIKALAECTENVGSAMYFALIKIDKHDDPTVELAETIKAKNYKHTNITFHEDVTFACGVLGYAMGGTTGLINSAFTMKFKQIIGAEHSPLKSKAVKKIQAANANCYVMRAKAQFEQGVCCDGIFIDDYLNPDKLANDIQLNIYDLLYGQPKVGNTDPGHSDIAAMITQANKPFVKTGYIAEGKWRRQGVLGLKKGDIVPGGHIVLWESVDEQSDADRSTRKSQPFYNCITTAGAVHSTVIKINVTR